MLKMLKYFTKKEWCLVALAIVFIVVSVWLDLAIPDYMSEITMLVQSPCSEMSDILSAGVKMLVLALGSLLSTVITSVCAARLAAGLGLTLRGKMFHKVQSFSMQEIGKFSTASLLTRTTNDIQQVQMLIIMGLQMLIKAPIMAVWAILKILGKSWQWSFATGAAVVILLITVGVCLLIATPKFKKVQTLTDNLNRVTRENLTGLNVVRAYNAERYQEDKFEVANEDLTSNQLFSQRTMSFMMPSIQLVMSGLSLAIYWIGSYLINAAALMEKATLFSEMVVFSSYAMQVVMSFMMLVMIFMMLPRATVSAARINEVLETKPTVLDGELTDGNSDKIGEVEFKNVSFRYPEADGDVIENISFKAKRGETIALIGATGCGKTTVVNLVMRFYDATAGEVLVDGVNVKDYSQKALRNKIGYVSQKATLFSGSISSNISFGDNGRDDIDENVIESAAKTSQAYEFIKNIDGEYDGYVAQGGANLSGGQKQRLSIARAIARRPEILIFDDSFSALDYKTDRVLRKALDDECGDTTRLIVAQRIGTIRDADKIIVLDDGKMVGIGKHDELMRDCEVYRQIAYSQLSKEELA